MTCPLCASHLTTFYSLSREEAVCICPNLECKANRLEGTGDSTEKAIKDFNDRCFRLDPNAVKGRFAELRKAVKG